MYIHLMIVDDESFTRDGLRNMIPWKDYGINRITTASNGIAALNIAKETPPDILLADVRMPKMDGIALAQKIHEMFPHCKIVFISAYSDKEYLKSAIQIQAKQYIEKPIILSEVDTIIREVINEIQAEKIEHETAHELVHGLEEAESLVEQYIVSSLLSHDLNIKQLYERYGKLYFTWHEDDICTPICINPLFTDKNTAILLKNRIVHFLDTYKEIPLVIYLIGFYNDDQIALLFRLPKRQDLVLTLIPALIKYINKGINSPYSVGIGPSAHGIRSIADNYCAAQKSADMYFYSDSERFFFSAPEGNEFSDSEAENLYQKICMEPDSIHVVCSHLKKQKYVNVPKVQDFLYRVHIRMLKRSETEELPIPRREFYRLSLDQITVLLEKNSTRIRILNSIDTDDLRILEIARFVLNQIDNNDLSIDLISRQCGFTANYLSTLFKQKTGQTLNSFIIHTRIETAKNLLLNTNLKLYEICDYVGVNDPNYFSDMFKRTVGVSPTAFRFKRNTHIQEHI